MTVNWEKVFSKPLRSLKVMLEAITSLVPNMDSSVAQLVPA